MVNLAQTLNQEIYDFHYYPHAAKETFTFLQTQPGFAPGFFRLLFSTVWMANEITVTEVKIQALPSTFNTDRHTEGADLIESEN